MKNITDFILEARDVVNGTLKNERLKKQILDGTLNPDTADQLFAKYMKDIDTEEFEMQLADLDKYSMEVTFEDFMNGEVKGSVSGFIATALDELGVDEYFFGLLCILNWCTV